MRRWLDMSISPLLAMALALLGAAGLGIAAALLAALAVALH